MIRTLAVAVLVALASSVGARAQEDLTIYQT